MCRSPGPLGLLVVFSLCVTIAQAQSPVDASFAKGLSPNNLTPKEFVSAARNVRKTFYWQKKDLATYVTLTKHLLATAIENSQVDNRHAEAFSERVLGLGYDLASMTWPGWDEQGIEISTAFQEVGLAAARMIVQAGIQYEAPAEVQHNNYWILGAHLLAAGDNAGARKAWRQALALHSHDEGLGMLTWIALADAMDGRNVDLLVKHLSKLDAGSEDLKITADQIRTARLVFQRETQDK